MCALFSQLHQHVDALEQAKKSVKLTHLLIKDMHSLCDFYQEKQRVAKATEDDSIAGSHKKDKPFDEMMDEHVASDDSKMSYDTSTAITAAAHNNLEDPLSLIEKTAMRVKPILEEVMKRMIPEAGDNVSRMLSQT